MTDFSPHRFSLSQSVNVTLTELADAHYGGNRSRAVRAAISEHAHQKENDIRLEELQPQLVRIESRCEDLHGLLDDTTSPSDTPQQPDNPPTPEKSDPIDDAATELFNDIIDSHPVGFQIHTLLNQDDTPPGRLHQALARLLNDNLITVSAESAPALYTIEGDQQ